MLVPTIVILINSAPVLIGVYPGIFFVLPFVGLLCPNLGTDSLHLNEAAALALRGRAGRE